RCSVEYTSGTSGSSVVPSKSEQRAGRSSSFSLQPNWYAAITTISKLARPLHSALGMTTKIHHVLLFAITSGFVGACGDDGPCLEGGNDGECVSGETGADDGGNLGCAPAEGFESGT